MAVVGLVWLGGWRDANAIVEGEHGLPGAFNLGQRVGKLGKVAVHGGSGSPLQGFHQGGEGYVAGRPDVALGIEVDKIGHVAPIALRRMGLPHRSRPRQPGNGMELRSGRQQECLAVSMGYVRFPDSAVGKTDTWGGVIRDDASRSNLIPTQWIRLYF